MTKPTPLRPLPPPMCKAGCGRPADPQYGLCRLCLIGWTAPRAWRGKAA